MSLFKTLKTRRTFAVKVANVQSQPVNNMSTSLKKASSSKLIASDVPISKLTSLTTSDMGYQKFINPSLSLIASKLSSDPQFMVPSFSSFFNIVRPSYLQHLNSKILRSDSSDDAALSTREFEPYERLTGISHERPEILMMTQFLPLFKKDENSVEHSYVQHLLDSGIDSSMTDAGWYIDTQINSRNLKISNVIKLIRSLSQKNASLDEKFATRNRDMGVYLNALKTIGSFFLDFVRRSSSLKSQLDLRNDIFITKPHQQIHKYSLNNTRIRLNWLNSLLGNVASKFIPPQYDVPDSLVRLGYKRKNADEIFSSTKLWMQLLYEYKSIIRDHSLEFLDIEPTIQKNDDNAVNITRSDVDLFNVKSTDPPGLLDAENLSSLPTTSIRSVVQSTTRAFSFIYEKGATFKSEEARIAGLASILSKEFNYSSGLSVPWVRRLLIDYFGYTPADSGNLNVFDVVIGQFGNNITEIPSVESSSLVSLGHHRPTSNVVVLPFESKYLEGTSGIMTPGSTWYVDDALKFDNGEKFNTVRLEEFSSKLKRSFQMFNIITNGFNIFQVSLDDNSNKKQQNFANILSNPARMIELQVKELLDSDGQTKPIIKNDRLTSIYTMAQSSPELKASLFIYTLTKINRSYNENHFKFLQPLTEDNTPLTDALVDNIVKLLISATKNSQATISALQNQKSTIDANDLDEETIKTALRQGTYLTNLIEQFMSNILASFASTNAFSGDRTVYSGHLDTIPLMIAFDIIISMVARYGNQHIIGRQQQGRKPIAKNGTFNYVVSKSIIRYNVSANDLINRLEREQGLIHQLTWSINNVMTALHNSIDGFVNHLKSKPTLEQLTATSSVIDNFQEFQELMSEHQIMLLGSTISDIVGRYQTIDNLKSDSNNQIKILDDSTMTPKIKNAIYGLFGTDEFTEPKAFNKRILTVGIPMGFTRRLQQKISTSTLKNKSFVAKQKDIVNISVYKIDMLNQDLIYKPKKFMFELSRFPVRNDVHFKNLPNNPTLEQIVTAIPTRDFDESFEESSGNAITYWHPEDNKNNNSNFAMNSETYEFLTKKEKAKIIKNHITSHLLEMYINLMTGMSVAEHHFDINPGDTTRTVEQDFIRELTENKISEVSDFITFRQSDKLLTNLSSIGTSRTKRTLPKFAGGLLFGPTVRRKVSHVKTTNSSGLSGKVNSTYQTKSAPNSGPKKNVGPSQRVEASRSSQLKRVDYHHIPNLVYELKNLSQFSKMKTSLSDGLQISKQTLRPKQFDRVFNVVIDPDEFEINYDETMSTQPGRDAFEMLLKIGEIIPAKITTVDNQSNQKLPLGSTYKTLDRIPSDPNINNYRYRDRDKNQGDLMFEKYFITIETYGEETI